MIRLKDNKFERGDKMPVERMALTYRAARVNAGYSQEQAAKLLGISRTILSKWENGDSEPKRSQMELMAKTYDVPVTVFFD